MDESGEVGVSTQDVIRADRRALFRGAIRLTLEPLLEEESRELVGAGRGQRPGDRKDVRNGTCLPTPAAADDLDGPGGAVDPAGARGRRGVRSSADRAGAPGAARASSGRAEATRGPAHRSPPLRK